MKWDAFNLCFGELDFHIKVGNLDKFKESIRQITSNNQNIKLTYIDGKACKEAYEVFKEFSNKLKFPTYFGYNWDALEECLTDLDWLQAEGHIIFIEHANCFSNLNLTDRNNLLEVLRTVVHDWRNGRDYKVPIKFPMPFEIILHCSDGEQNMLIKNLEALDIVYELLI